MTGQLELLVALEKGSAADEANIIERIRKAMKATKDHWMITDEDLQFRAALGIAMVNSDETDKARIVRSFQPLKSLSAMMSGVSVDVDAMTRELDHDDLIPLMKMWKET